jgi:heme oxygenase
MSVMNSTTDRLRRATALWHAYLSITGQRFELALFLKDPAFEKQTLDSVLASGDAKLVSLAQDWLRDTGQGAPQEVESRGMPPAATPAEAAKPPRYLRGVR